MQILFEDFIINHIKESFKKFLEIHHFWCPYAPKNQVKIISGILKTTLDNNKI